MEKINVVLDASEMQDEIAYLNKVVLKYQNKVTSQMRNITEIQSYIVAKYSTLKKDEINIKKVGRNNLIYKHLQNPKKQQQALELPLDQITCLEILCEGNGRTIYEKQNEDYQNLDKKLRILADNQYESFLPIEPSPIYIWFDTYFNDYQIEGSPSLLDELKLVFGLSELEMNEPTLMYDYIKLLVEQGSLEKPKEPFRF